MKRIRLACQACKNVKLKCDNFAPCTRCTRLNMQGSCIRVRVEKGRRKRGSDSCVPCKQSKVKCDEGRPCSRCKQKRKEDGCVYQVVVISRHIAGSKDQDHDHTLAKEQALVLEQEQGRDSGSGTDLVQASPTDSDQLACMQELQVERPLDFWARSLSFDQPSLLREHMNSMGWPDRVLARHLEIGYCSKDVMNIFVSLPPRLQEVTRRALDAMEIIMADKMMKQAGALPAQLLMGSEKISEEDLELERVLYGNENFGMVNHYMLPSTGQRMYLYVSDATCRILGLHAEEALARLASRELPLVMTEFNFFCYIVFSTWFFATYPGRPLSLVVCIRDIGSKREKGGVITRLVQQPEFDCYGRMRSMKTMMFPLDKESNESLVENHHDPLSTFNHLISGGRDFDTWINDFESDMSAGETILGMQKSKQGMERLEALERELVRMYQPFVEHADRILKEKMPGPAG
ncbi:hypothetical protein GUITHDRAFT_122402 [Guillardia theta CCMP2712]|uniref:Zn(2)-C6 fungal-type domain-containing protein n=1 Tax=Guillardia theta (strain CCMP2712) TaxID=905079 RepID=L1I6A8_GUITC|nr:hypothetical protein GUITHDRAFT_122402 [Guillardia theta CCMP2712]EKX31395.1 hypothetical protein GUITHDRAFT_122402 [Guillardia theta CCMP2712]|eukprot:XP_005818375.1 hypothetical protein GUITHDRAFT_122402 [Guillardia theta CCMP2712]